jgi:hypothetical protein
LSDQATGVSPDDNIHFVGVGTVTPILPGFTFDRAFVVDLTDSSGTALSTQLTLPTSVNVADFDSNRWFVGVSRISDGQFAFVNGSLPVPDTLWPTLAGLVAIAVYAERIRRRATTSCASGLVRSAIR